MTEISQADVLLMRAMAGGKRDALGSLYDRYSGVGYALALGIVRDAGVADEILQDAFVALWRNARSFDESRCSPRTWFFTIVRNRAIDELRRRNREPQRVALDDAQPAVVAGDPWPEVWKRSRAAAIRSAMRELSLEQRETIELGFFGGLSHAQIAERLGAPLGTVKKRMRSGLQRLGAMLRDDGESIAR